ncbi:MAG: 16S rRNA (adenine(1518)-N(6)/adenine(1519)-N(6))-dimethyltransferase RsmA [Pseudomonadota bacterium]
MRERKKPGLVKSQLDARIAALPSLRTMVMDSGFVARRKLGQNFLFDLNITRKIALYGGPYDDGDPVIEIGPGPGALTRALLLEGVERLIAVELDPRCTALLQPLAKAAEGRLVVHCGDARKIGLCELIGSDDMKVRIVANLPYHIALVLIVDWLKKAKQIHSITVMVQLEVARRLVAKVGMRDYGRISVLAGLNWNLKILFQLAPDAFVPKPDVTSAVVQFVPCDRVQSFDYAALERVTRAAFLQRRKMLRSSLKPVFGSQVEQVCAEVGIDSSMRAEMLSPHDYAKLADYVSTQQMW